MDGEQFWKFFFWVLSGVAIVISALSGVVAKLYHAAETRNTRSIEDEKARARLREEEMKAELKKHEEMIKECETDRSALRDELTEIKVAMARIEGEMGRRLTEIEANGNDGRRNPGG